MAKRGYKLQEFVAHSGNVNCLSFGKKNCRVFITGGDDQKVNLWSVGKPTSLMSLCGHTSPVESATFDSAEVLVAAGSSSGAIKLWDLEETKMVRTLTGHRSYCTALEFHPFGEFFASGSMDTNLKIWDIRKKGCIHTYKGHTRGISTIRFTPDGRWVVSGGFDNVVKIWDLTAGKLLHEFKFHEGHIRSIEFHPLEFLLATGSADKTVKFWDLETFEMIGSARREATGVRSIAFHPDGRTLFCGLDDSLKVYSWEPVICHDSVDMGWSTLGDLCISDGKLLGGAYYENSVAVWVADVSLIEPYGSRLAPEQNSHVEQKCDSQGSPLEKEEKIVNSKSNLRSTTPDSDSKEIKTIYVDCVNSITSKTVDPLDTPKVPLPSDSREVSTIGTQKRGSAVSIPAKSSVRAGNRSLVMPSIIPRDGPDGKDSVGSRRQSLAPAKVSSSLSAKPHHTRRFSSGRFDMEKMSVSLDAMPYDSLKITLGCKEDSNLRNRLVVDENAKESSKGKQSSTKTVAERVDRTPSAETVSSTGDPALSSSEGVKPVKVVNGVAVVHGRTRSLVERFERREKIDVDEINRPHSPSGVTSEPVETPLSQSDDQQMVKRFEGNDQQTIKRSGSSGQLMAQRLEGNDQQTIKNLGSNDQLMIKRLESNDQQTIKRSGSSGQLMVQRLEGNDQQNVKSLGSNDQLMVERLESTDQLAVKRSGSNDQLIVKRLESTDQQTIKRSGSNNHLMVKRLESTDQQTVKRLESNDHLMVKRLESIDQRIVKRPGSNGQLMVKRLDSNEQQTIRRLGSNDQRTVKRLDINDQRMTKRLENHDQKMIKRLESNDQQTVMTEQPTSGEVSIIEDLMQNHDMLLSTFRSRLTKLQVVRHFWERNDIKGAIGAVKKLPDHSVQADVIGALIEKMEIITLDLFSCLLPVLLGLLESKVERHATVSLEMLLKLVAVFGTTVRSTISARRAVGVDLHAEERLECCKQCFAHLQSVQNILPELVRRGGAVARYSQQLNLVLQQL